MSNILSLNKISRSYLVRETLINVFSGIDIDIKKGEKVVIIGPSGSGKTSILNIAGLIERPNSGSVYINNSAVDWKSDKKISNLRKKNIGYVFQDFALFPHINAEKNIKYAMSINENVLFDRLSNELSLSNHLSKMPYELSGGQQQRVALARAILMKPNLLLLDEPFSNLDQKNITIAQDLIKNILNEFKIPCLLVSHNPNQLESLSITNEITIG